MSRGLGDSLRRRAERLVGESLVDGSDIKQLLHELCVHQAELEIQNEELREAQQAIEGSRRQYLQLFELMPAACFTVDISGVVGATNRRAETLFRAGRRRLRGRPVLLMVDRRDHARLHHYLDHVRDGLVSRLEEFTFHRADGSSFDGLLDSALVRNPETSTEVVLCSVVDVSERNRAVEALRAATLEVERSNTRLELALASKTKFLASASHDLRQPVQALSMFVDVLEQQELAPPARIVAGRIRDSLTSLSTLLGGLLDISRLEAGLVRPTRAVFSSGDLMRRLAAEFSMLAESKGLRFRLMPVDVPVVTDPALLERILRNILSNAARYTDTGGILFGARRRNGHLRLEVWDSGPGIPSDHLELIFEDFHQVGNTARNSQEGLGLGLAIVSRLARLLECTVNVLSRVNHGSRFSVDVPIDANAVAERSPQPSTAAPFRHGGTATDAARA